MYVTVLAVIFFWPMLSVAWWHVVHGRSIDVAGRRLNVPWSWQVFQKEQIATIVKRPITLKVNDLETPSGSLGPVPHVPQNEKERAMLYESFVSQFWNKLVREGDSVLGPTKFGPANIYTICMDSFPRNKQNWVHLVCLTSKGRQIAIFDGNVADKDVFLHEILGLTELPDSNIPDS